MAREFQTMQEGVNTGATEPPSRPASRTRRRRARVGALSVALAWACFAIPVSEARVNPLVVIERQLHKANMLIVLDTSGSMTGVPGGLFANSSEAGVDCDSGMNCRNGGVQGLCKVWGRTCMADLDCRQGYCSKDGVTACNSTDDCPQDSGVCSAPGVHCDMTTATNTVTSTDTVTRTETVTNTATNTNTETLTGTQTGTGTQTATGTMTSTLTQTLTPTRTVTSTQTPTNTRTATTTRTLTNTTTQTTTQTVTNTSTQTTTQTLTNIQTVTGTQTVSSTSYQTQTANATVTVTGYITATNTATLSLWWWYTWQTATFTTTDYLMGGATGYGTSTVTATYNGSITKAFTATSTVSGSATSTDTETVYFPSWRTTSTVSMTSIWTHTGTKPATVTERGTGAGTVAETWTYVGTASTSSTQTGTTTQSSTSTQTSTNTQTYTATKTATNTQSSTNTQTTIGTESYTSTQSSTATETYTVSQTYTATQTNGVTQSTTITQTSTNSQTSTATQTATGTRTVTETQTATGTQTALGAISCTTTKDLCDAKTACPDPKSACTQTGNLCNSDADCAGVGKCKYSSLVCPNPGGNCPGVSVCAHSATTICTTASDCPALPGTGTCSAGGTPQGGCTGIRDCPSYKRCSVTNDSCVLDTDCPLQSTGLCSGLPANTVCNSGYRRCPSGQTCVFSGQRCLGNDNNCNLPLDTCDAKTDNTCLAATNTCATPPNTCVYPPTNTCVQPASPTDTCVEAFGGKPGPIRMCIIGQTVCKNDSDCKTTGDSCGPATSRAVIAKRAISAVVQGNFKLLNFGLMTFYQNGYYPYFLNTSSTTGVVPVFQAVDRLSAAHCWSRRTGLASTCYINGMTMTLRGSPNSRYRVRTSETSWIDADADYCGPSCNLPGDIGIGEFEGAYYEFTARTGANSSTMNVQSSYSGKDITIGGTNYTYYQPLTNYYNGGASPPLDFPNCGSRCSAECGGRWNEQLAPFLDTSDNPDSSQNAAGAITQAMAPAAYGGLLTYWSTPTGCTLQNDVAKTINTSAYDYMYTVKNGNLSANIPADHLACRDNYVLLITDGQANGPGDDNCDAAACAAADPVAAGCQCRAVLAAYNLRKNLGVKTFVVGFSGDVSAGAPRIVNDNIAHAGGTDAGDDGVAPFAYLAQNEDQLNRALQLVIYNAVRGSYSTAPTSTSAGTQQATTVAEGRYALDSRMDFPEWKGHLLAYDLSGATPTLAWDAYQRLASANWWQRRVYTWDGTNMVKIAVDPVTHAVTNGAVLADLGMGATPAEAEKVARWMLGDPTFGNPAVLGAIINSTPIDVASPGDLSQPGGHEFFLQHQNRPHLIYVGSSDGLLHTFFLENTTVGSTTYQAGSEAFAFLPPDMMPVVRQQYAQGGQKPDPYSHIFGLADSPKAKTLCVSHCDDAATAVWKTLLIMPEGYGGGQTFMLDVTSPLSASGIADPPVTVEWHTGYGTKAATYGDVLGNTISLPAFFFKQSSSLDDYRVIFTSGYPVTDGSTTQGRALVTAAAATGNVLTTSTLTPAATCSQEYTALTDVATARDFAKGQDNKLVAGYFGDTSGQLFRYVIGASPVVDQALTCNHPLHFAPTVVQLDRDSYTSAHGHEIYPVQVTNSNLDLDTVNLPPSKMVFWKEVLETDNGGNQSMTKDPTWGNGGQIALTAGNNNEICGVTTVDAHGIVSCVGALPVGARPTSTPIGVLLADASGFEVLTMWYLFSPDGCTRGQTYLTIHRISATGTVNQRLGALVAHEPVTSPVILGGRIFIFGASGATEITSIVPDAITAGRAIPPNGGTGQFLRMSWSEVLQ